MSACTFIKDRVGYGLAAPPVLTDWIDTGHWPHHPREFATEVVISVVIFFGVHRLMGRAKKFKEASETDSLTGLGNRARFRSTIPSDTTQATRLCAILAGHLLGLFGENIPTVGLYYDRGSGTRYRSLGCEPCQASIVSSARKFQEILVELRSGRLQKIAERSGRLQDGKHVLEELRRGGYM